MGDEPVYFWCQSCGNEAREAYRIHGRDVCRHCFLRDYAASTKIEAVHELDDADQQEGDWW